MKKFDKDGNMLLTWKTCSDDEIGANIRPISFAFDSQGNLFTQEGGASDEADNVSYNHRVQKFRKDELSIIAQE